MKDEIEQYFSEHRDRFRSAQPPKGHEQRFRSKLAAQASGKSKSTLRRLWLPLAWAASLALAVLAGGVFLGGQDNASSTALKQTTQHFENRIQEQKSQLVSSEAKGLDTLLQDAQAQLEQLQSRQKQIMNDYRRTGGDPRILKTVIQNYQLQLQVLEDMRTRIFHQINNQEDDYRQM